MKYKRYIISKPQQDIFFLNRAAKDGKCKILVNYPRYKTSIIKTPISIGLTLVGQSEFLVVAKFPDKFTETTRSNMRIPYIERENLLQEPRYTFLVEDL